MNSGSSVDIVIILLAVVTRWSLIPSKVIDLHVHYNVQAACKDQSLSSLIDTGAIKRSDREADRSPSPGAEVILRP
jgi:hypothetical protein